MKKKIIMSMLLLSMAGSCMTAYGEDISQSKERLNQAAEEKQELEGKLNKKSAEVENALKEIEKIDAQERVATAEFQKAQAELGKTEAELADAKAELKKAEETLKEKQDAFNSRVSVMYKNSSAGYLEVVLGSTDIVDLFNRVGMIKDIAGYDAEIIAEVKAQKEIISKKGKELEVKQEEAKVATRKAEAKKTEIANIASSKIAYMETLKNDEVAFRSGIDRLEAESEAILENIKIEEEKIAEEARRVEAARKAEAAKSQSTKTPSTSTQVSQNTVSNTPSVEVPVAQNPSNPAPQVPSGSGMIRPVSGGYVSSEFGENRGYIHKGIDVAIPSGTPVMAATDGVVLFSGYEPGYGEYIYISHGNGMVTVYAHNSQRLVTAGQAVSKGQVISYSGNTGNSTGPHLHFEVVINGSKVNPRNYIGF